MKTFSLSTFSNCYEMLSVSRSQQIQQLSYLGRSLDRSRSGQKMSHKPTARRGSLLWSAVYGGYFDAPLIRIGSWWGEEQNPGGRVHRCAWRRKIELRDFRSKIGLSDLRREVVFGVGGDRKIVGWELATGFGRSDSPVSGWKRKKLAGKGRPTGKCFKTRKHL